MNRNKVLLIGYTGMDPICKKTNDGNKQVRIRMATHYPRTNEKGEKVYHTIWHNVIAWDSKAEYAERSFVKGSKILVDGSISYRTYLDQTGHTRYVTDIIAHSLINLDR
jgi:single-strand DNA-binding protein